MYDTDLQSTEDSKPRLPLQPSLCSSFVLSPTSHVPCHERNAWMTLTCSLLSFLVYFFGF